MGGRVWPAYFGLHCVQGLPYLSGSGCGARFLMGKLHGQAGSPRSYTKSEIMLCAEEFGAHAWE